ncbi:Rgg family transcriptional regulator [Vagococcus sp.]|uniref:helix-turn-helix domain-containing protein n=1 Tax=Vagococcus sp. TaxID=1933889 RepID=UPI003F9CD1C6
MEGALFRSLRESRHLTLQQVSDEMNSVSFISKFEKGQSNISLVRFERLLQQINMTVEEFFYLRSLQINPTLNQDLSPLMMYQSSDFYLQLAKVIKINSNTEKTGYPTAITELTLLKNYLKRDVRWQRFLLTYIDILIISMQTNLKRTLPEDNFKYIKDVMTRIKKTSQPISTYLVSVDNWGVFEIILFRLFLFSFPLEQSYTLLKLALKRTEKEIGLPSMKVTRMEIIFSSFSLFVNYRKQEWAKETLDIAEKLLKDKQDCFNNILLIFYQGWYQIIFNSREHGIQKCEQALSLFKILDQPTLYTNYQKLFQALKNSSLNNPNSFIFV